MKITAKLFGGIGNQLFIYAAVRRLALNNNCSLFLDISSGFASDQVYKRTFQLNHFKISNEVSFIYTKNTFIKKILRRINIFINNLLPFNFRYYIIQYGNDFDPRIIRIKNLFNLFIEGYWQSEFYFSDIEKIIRSELEIIPPTDNLNKLTSELILSSESVSVHIRFFNVDDVQNSLNIIDYLKNSFNIIESKCYNPKFFIFSNDLDQARELSILKFRNCTFIGHNYGDDQAYADLWLMSLCKHHIISNSTFSWWGAWLANNQDGIIISPNIVSKDNIVSWGFDGNLPSHWIKI
ncbi:alpha-1,2-fucosyltransferase [Polynucleobacter sp. MWH-S4W17]|uniref:alpha-1,2-fucosyltransferase n=1 Tax=Polynucleobacter sp. MWH-S4W17 TaxID=1855910 RepID=UPI001BFEE745|nr:alpha-1,2-fucosyltransferase [Polynucleobacter sp. MWH-S4W17]QWD81932.1 alpha-1,2-fucosyltransferase [Polynucleobacter sp. MWH-S4W17]